MPKSVFEGDIDKATSEYNVSEDWQMIMDITDKIKSTTNGSKDSLKCIMRRINHPIPHVSMQALTLLNACVDNCGKSFHLEICSREWVSEARTIITRGHQKVSEKMRELVQKWADEFKEDPQLHLMVKFYKQLKTDGFSFDHASASTSASSSKSGGSTNSKADELSFKEDLDIAIAMSLQESESSKAQSSGGSSLYPSVMTSSSPVPTYAGEPEIFQVRAVYDFEAAEDNEMTFKAGEIFSVLDNSDENWWKGRNQHGVGLFPANFVTTDLEEKSDKKKVRFADEESSSSIQQQQQQQQQQSTPADKGISVETVGVNEEHLELTLSMLKNASPIELDDEEETILAMEETSVQMGPLIEKKILQCERRKDDLGDLSEKFSQALNMYQQLMKEPVSVAPPVQNTTPQQPAGYSNPQQALQYQQAYAMQHGYQPANIGYDSRADVQQVAQMDGGYYSQNPVGSQASALPASSYPTTQLYSQQMEQPSSQQNGYDTNSYQLPPSYSYDDGINYSQQSYVQGQYYGAENNSYAYQQAADYSNYGYVQQPQQQTSVYQ